MEETKVTGEANSATQLSNANECDVMQPQRIAAKSRRHIMNQEEAEDEAGT